MKTVQNEIESYVKTITPPWKRALAEHILQNDSFSVADIANFYSRFLEKDGSKPESEKDKRSTDDTSTNEAGDKPGSVLSKLENVEGVNALVENQSIDFHKNLTIIYGENGSGKSGYVRLLKEAFNSRSPENILSNIYDKSAKQGAKADFIFSSEKVSYPDGSKRPEFKQFAVFDNKSVSVHTGSEKHKIAFQPAAFRFFSRFVSGIEAVKQKRNDDRIRHEEIKNTFNPYFLGESDIKSFVEKLSAKTSTEDIEKHSSFSDDDKNRRKIIVNEIQNIESRENQIKLWEDCKQFLLKSKTKGESINNFFTEEHLNKIKNKIADYLVKVRNAKTQSEAKFDTDGLDGIGGKEWKGFITAAKSLANIQKHGHDKYPEKGDKCLLCQQSLSEEAKKLLDGYWIFIRGEAAAAERDAQSNLNNKVTGFEGLDFNLFPDGNKFVDHLTEKFNKDLEELNNDLSDQKAARDKIISGIRNKSADEIIGRKLNTKKYEDLDNDIVDTINNVKKGDLDKKCEEWKKEKTFLDHKKLFTDIKPKIEKHVETLRHIEKISKETFSTKDVTSKEQALFKQYFADKYCETFKKECEALGKPFDEVEIEHTGQKAESYKKLKVGEHAPDRILSDGEQKIIALADFLAEMELSEGNRGIIFDDPVSSLDHKHRATIAERFVEKSAEKQVIIFTHDLVFYSAIEEANKKANKDDFYVHTLENEDKTPEKPAPGKVWLNTSPSIESEWRTTKHVKNTIAECEGEQESLKKQKALLAKGFGELRTCYEVLVSHWLLHDVVLRFDIRISMGRLKYVRVTKDLVDRIVKEYAICSRNMTGHIQSDLKPSQPTLDDLKSAVHRYDAIRVNIKDLLSQENRGDVATS